jgi:hypothetical protein
VCVRIVKCDDVFFPYATDSSENIYVMDVSGLVLSPDGSAAGENGVCVNYCIKFCCSVSNRQPV